MELSVVLQLRELGWALLFGIGAGLSYDLLRPLRQSRWSTMVADALYALLLLFALLAFALYAGRGRLRLFALAAMALTGGLWLWLISPLFRQLECLRRRLSRKILQKLQKFSKQRKKIQKMEKKSCICRKI